MQSSLAKTAQALLILAACATILPVTAEYVFAFGLLIWLTLSGHWPLVIGLWRGKTTPGLDPHAASRYRAAILPLHCGTFALVLSHLLAALAGWWWAPGSKSLVETLRIWSHMGSKLGLVWIVISGAQAAAWARGWNPRHIAPYLAAWLLIHCLYAVVQRQTGIDLVHGWQARLPDYRYAYGVFRVSGFMGHPLTLAYNLLLVLCAATAMLLHFPPRPPDRRQYWPWLMIAAASGLTLFISGSRFVLLVILMVFGVCEWRHLWRWRWRWLGLGASAAGFLWLDPAIMGRFSELVTSGVPLTQRLTRLGFWQVHWQMFKDSPWFGVTMANYENAAPTYYAAAGIRDNIYAAHNIFLQTLADTGLIGASGLAIFLVCWGMAFRRLGSDGAGLRYLGVATLLAGMMQNVMRDSAFIYALWFYLGFMLIQGANASSSPSRPSRS